MKELKSVKTTTYDVGDGFFIDIVYFAIRWDTWIYHKDYDLKALMSTMDVEAGDFTAFERAQSWARSNVSDWKDDYRRAVILMGEDD